MPSWDANYAYEQFKRLRAVLEAANGTNEGTTRLRSINTMLTEVLGWDLKDVEAETHVREQGYADYVLLQHDSPSGVVEAKKDGEAFVLTGARYSAEPVGFGLLSKESKPAREAVAQAAGYAASLGARYVAATNGHQYIVTLAFVQGVPIEHRSVLVFESLDAIDSRFRAFFEALSPSGMSANSLSTKLLESRRAPAPTKLSGTIVGYPKPADRNVLANEIGWVLSTVWDKTNENRADEKFLRHCYIVPEATKGILAQAREIIEQRKKTDDRAAAEVGHQSDVIEMVSNHSPERPVILLGRVGHGKSTFLSYLRLIEAKALLAGYIQVEIDFLDRPTAAPEVQAHVFRAFDEQILERYEIDIREAAFARGALRGELARFRRTVKGSQNAPDSPEQKRVEDEFVESYQKDEYRYLTAVVKHLRRSHHKSIAIFFDNLDRRIDPLQEEAFLQASSLARDWEALVFVCLRPGTFHRSAAAGTLDAIAPRTIGVSPPRIDLVLKKRFEFAIEFASGRPDPSRPSNEASFGAKVAAELPTAASFFECCRDSFSTSQALTQVFAAVANGDIRALLRYVRDFMTSQHLNTKKIVKKIQEGGYSLAPHEAVRALLYGDYFHYSPQNSVFPNVFDIQHADGLEHFARLLSLHHLQRQPDSSSSHGFVASKDIVEYLCQIGFGQSTAQSTLDWLLESKLTEDRLGESIVAARPDQVRITPLGRFVASELASTFVYMDAVVVDTPVTDIFVRAQIRDVFAIDARLTRCREFKKYLDACSKVIKDADATAFWHELSKRLDTDIAGVASRIGAPA